MYCHTWRNDRSSSVHASATIKYMLPSISLPRLSGTGGRFNASTRLFKLGVAGCLLIQDWGKLIMSRETMNHLQQIREQQVESERKKHGGSCLTGLYNLHLPEGRLSREHKIQLVKVRSLFVEQPLAPLPLDDSLDNNSPPIFPLSVDEMEEEWWCSDDVTSFPRNYQHVCSLVESCIGEPKDWNFHQPNLEWLDRKMRLIPDAIFLEMKNPVSVVPGNRGTLKPVDRRSKVPSESIIGYVPAPAIPGQTLNHRWQLVYRRIFTWSCWHF